VADERIELRSYQPAFKVERRLYRIQHWQLPVPGGVPLRGVVYFVVALLLVLLLGALPLVGDVLGALSPPLRYVVLPLGATVLGTQVAPDGRSAHRFALDWLAYGLRAKRRSAGRAVPARGERSVWDGELPVRSDERSAGLRRARVRGPAAVYFRGLVDVKRGRRGRITARPHRAGGRRGQAVLDSVELGDGERLELRP